MPAARRPSILAQIAEIRQARATAPLRAAQNELAAILDKLNALGALDDIRRARFSAPLSAGPKVVSGLTPAPWVGVVVWVRPAGYFGYKTLTLFGVWAVAETPPRLIVDTKRLPYAAPFFDAEAYHKLFKKGFETYYGDNAATPPENSPTTFVYEDEQRLQLRDTLAAALAEVAQKL
jgi:hypothetical protein